MFILSLIFSALKKPNIMLQILSFSHSSSPIWDPDYKQPTAMSGGAKVAAALAAVAVASGSSDSDSLSSRLPDTF